MQKVSVSGRRASRGFTLVELMIAMVLGLIIIGGVISVFIANKQTYRTNEALSQVQDHARTAFEFLARDIRMAGLTGCGNLDKVANVLNNKDSDWYANFDNAVRGYNEGQADPAAAFGTGVAERVAGTDSFQTLGAAGTGFSVANHKTTSAQFKINESTTDFYDGALVIVCDPVQASIMQITNYNSSNVTVVHNTGTGDPGNCSKGLGYPTECTTNGNEYEYGPNSQMALLEAAGWYVGNNPAGGRSLYKVQLDDQSGEPIAQAIEMVRNVTNMQLTYHVPGNSAFVAASSVSDDDWSEVDAVRVSLAMQSDDDRVGTDDDVLRRSMSTTVTIRNRVN
ncbi:PilW family protein [Guyparkeria hydrothermalis]|uniref:PilW family protein n=1 Tax=Guyparkeria hydrothermalis TaxID=923 RepID=UPI00201FB729|nr:PilW family protein [Guyparkeria hydrothermalis]MCL7745066.1 PilW family protein [Guyparkeria hydrothermalis]